MPQQNNTYRLGPLHVCCTRLEFLDMSQFSICGMMQTMPPWGTICVCVCLWMATKAARASTHSQAGMTCCTPCKAQQCSEWCGDRYQCMDRRNGWVLGGTDSRWWWCTQVVWHLQSPQKGGGRTRTPTTAHRQHRQAGR